MRVLHCGSCLSRTTVNCGNRSLVDSAKRRTPSMTRPTAARAVYLAAINDYDAIVLDVVLPVHDGIEVCREIRRKGSHAPILMLTARDTVDDKILGLDAGADDYLTKPFDFGELLARLRALVRRRGDVLPGELSVADLVVDTRRHSAKRGNREIVLTTKEYALLEHLVRNAGRIVTRAEINAHVWDDNHDPFSNLIDVYVSRLRRKVDGGERVALISTRRGVGLHAGRGGTAPRCRAAPAREPMMRWPQSLRARLTLWYTLVLGVPLVAFAGASFFVLDRALMHRADSFLDETLGAFTTELASEQQEEPTAGRAIAVGAPGRAVSRRPPGRSSTR